MKLTLIYHVFKNITYLDKSLKALVNQTDKNFELILVNDGASDKVIEILNAYNFSSLIKNFKYIHINENQGHSFSFNEALKQSSGEYVYYLGSNIVLLPKFVEHINKTITGNDNVDVISITHVYDKKKPAIANFDSLNKGLKYLINPSIRDKIFSKKFLNSNNIQLDEGGYFPLVFLYKVLSNFKSWVVINDELIDYFNNTIFVYNLYDIIWANDLLIKNYSTTPFWKKNKDLIEYLMILYATRIFLTRIFLSHKEKHIRKGALNYSHNWLTHNIPNWKKNTILNSDRADLSEKSRERILHIFDRNFFKKIFGEF